MPADIDPETREQLELLIKIMIKNATAEDRMGARQDFIHTTMQFPDFCNQIGSLAFTYMVLHRVSIEDAHRLVWEFNERTAAVAQDFVAKLDAALKAKVAAAMGENGNGDGS